MDTKEHIKLFKQNVKKFEHLLEGLECDGASRIIQYKMRRTGLYAQKSYIEYGDELIPHYWCQFYTANDIIIFDYKSKMWFGDKALQGIFTMADAFHNGVNYDGIDVKFNDEHTKLLILSQNINKQLKL